MMRGEQPASPVASSASSAPGSAPFAPVTVRWIPDEEVSLCTGCHLLFDWVRRKHHCRCVLRLLCVVVA